MTARQSAAAALVLFLGALAVGIPLGRWNEQHRRQYTYAFPDLQDATAESEAKRILGTWRWTTGATDAIRRAMQLDLAFPLFYAPLLALLAWRAALGRTKPWLVRLGRVIAFLALFGGLADLAENATMLTMLGEAGSSRFAMMRIFTHVKIAGILAAVLYVSFAHLNGPDASASDVPPNT